MEPITPIYLSERTSLRVLSSVPMMRLTRRVRHPRLLEALAIASVEQTPKYYFVSFRFVPPAGGTKRKKKGFCEGYEPPRLTCHRAPAGALPHRRSLQHCCHPERSEGSALGLREILRFTQ